MAQLVVAVLTLVVAVAAVGIAWRQLRKARDQLEASNFHHLYVDAPDAPKASRSQLTFALFGPFLIPARPRAWCPPFEDLLHGKIAVACMGTLQNAGPAAAFSIEICGLCPENREGLRTGLSEASELAMQFWLRSQLPVAARDHWQPERGKIWPALQPSADPSEGIKFSVFGIYDADDPWIEAAKSYHHEGLNVNMLYWECDGEQAHPLHVTSKTIDGKLREWEPNELCLPGASRP